MMNKNINIKAHIKIFWSFFGPIWSYLILFGPIWSYLVYTVLYISFWQFLNFLVDGAVSVSKSARFFCPTIWLKIAPAYLKALVF